MLQFSVQNVRLSEGYAALNRANPDSDDPRDPDWVFVEKMFCEDVAYADPEKGTEFPAWYPMHEAEAVSDGAIRGRVGIIEHLKTLRRANTTAQLLAVATHGTRLISLDFTRTTRDEGNHVCADEIVFDESGCIKEFRHCAAGTHQHRHADS